MADEATQAATEAQSKYEQQIAELRQKVDQIEREKSEAVAKGGEWEQRYNAEMQQVREWAQQVNVAYQRAMQEAQSKAPPARTEDEDEIATNKSVSERIRQMQQETVQQVAQAMGQQQLQAWKSQREANRRFALSDPELEDISKYIGEIDQLLDAVHPQNAAANGAYREAYNIVWARHAMKARDEAKRKAAEAPAEDDEEAGEEQAAEAIRQAGGQAPPTSGHFGAPMPSPTARSAAGARTRVASREPEDDFEEHVVTSYYNGNRKEYLRDLQSTKRREVGNDPYDVLGMNGRTRA